ILRGYLSGGKHDIPDGWLPNSHMRRLYRLFLYLSSFTCSFLLAASPSIAQCNLDNLNPSYCEDDPAFALTGGTNYWVNNTATSSFDPSALGTGTHRVVTTDGTALTY